MCSPSKCPSRSTVVHGGEAVVVVVVLNILILELSPGYIVVASIVRESLQAEVIFPSCHRQWAGQRSDVYCVLCLF